MHPIGRLIVCPVCRFRWVGRLKSAGERTGFDCPWVRRMCCRVWFSKPRNVSMAPHKCQENARLLHFWVNLETICHARRFASEANQQMPSALGQRQRGGCVRFPKSARFRSVTTRLGRWRDLSLPTKLALVMIVPMIVMITLGGVLISGQLANSAQFARASRLTELSSSIRGSIAALQAERVLVADPGTTTAAFRTARTTSDAALAATRQAIAADTANGDLDPVAGSTWSVADRQLGELTFLRAETSAPSPDRSAVVSAYSQLVDSLFAFDRVLATGLADADLTQEALALYDLSAAREEVSYQQAVVLAGIARHILPPDDVTSLHGSLARLASRISDFRAVASQDAMTDYAAVLSGPVLARQNDLLGQAINESGGMGGQAMPGAVIDIPVAAWNAANGKVIAGLADVTDHLAAHQRSDTTTLRARAGTAAATAIIALVAAIAATIVLMVLVARQLLRSIGVLRRTARDVASRQLPDAVERIRAGETVDVTVAPVGVHTSDEIGQLARAFDAVHGEALRLAVEQANLRANYSELFVNLSRRSQSLVQRQLRLIEQLERDEEDPDQLSALFKLDHLATRMRRNNENLMVLSGSELARGGGQPIPLADLLRAGVSEIEHYQRIVVQPPPDAHVVGYAAGDLVRLLAELLDNATAFSAPDTPVTVASHRTRRRAIVIDIVDHGIGMNDEDLVRANEQLSQPAGVEGRITRRMGLFVISRLANQHGIRVRLHGGQDIPGLRVTITVPVELVIGDPAAPVPPPSIGDGGGGPGGLAGPLPKRVARASGAPLAVRSAPTDAVTGTITSDDPVAAAVTVTIPAATSSGVGLFAPLPAEPVVADGGEAVDEPTEVTPIYDTMVSAWFDDDIADDWRGAADQGWQAVDAVADAPPVDFTPAGLPRRQPKARLLPGSVLDRTATAAPAPRAPAEVIRERLSGFQQGIRRGRHHAAEPTAPAAPAPAPPAPPAPAEEDGLRPPAEPPVAVTEVQDASTWASSADEGWRAVDKVTAAAGHEVTAAGLPRRQPNAHLLPGSVSAVAPNGSAGPQSRDADALRDRMNSFQRGVRQGRDEPAGTPVEHGFHW
jgi:signal transduction histidine kinase